MPNDAIDLLFDWQEEREVEREQDDTQPDARSRFSAPPHRPRKPWPPREVTEEELASGPTLKCRRCERVYPETVEFFRRGRYYHHICRGCRRKERWGDKERSRTFGFRVSSLKTGAGKRRLEWGFDNREDLREFWDTPCHYCGGEVTQRLGLDRVDNDKGYIPGNVVQCCTTCNSMKLDLSVDEWVAHMKKVLEHLES